MTQSLFTALALVAGAAMAVVILPTASGLDSVGQSIHGVAGPLISLLGLFAAVAVFGVLVALFSPSSRGL